MSSKDQRLLLGCASSNYEAVKKALDDGADLSVLNEEKQTGLHIAATNGSYEIVKELVLRGADVEAKDRHGWTPLLCSASMAPRDDDAHIPILLFLLSSACANPTAKTSSGKTSMHFLARLKYMTPEIRGAFSALQRGGADFSEGDSAGQTPLHQACLHGCAAIVELLISFGAFVDADDLAEQTPLHIAARRGDTSVARVLLRFGASISAVGPNGVAKDEAFMNNHQEVVDLIEEWQAMMSGTASSSEASSHVSLGALKSSKDLGLCVCRTYSPVASQSRDASGIFSLASNSLKTDSGQFTLSSSSLSVELARRPRLQRTDTTLRARQEGKRILYRHKEFNIESGTEAGIDTELKLEYSDDHDRCLFTERFTRQPERWLEQSGSFFLDEDDYLPHLNFAGVKGGDVVIVSVLTTPSERDGESGQGYYCLLRAPHADTPGWLPVENVKKHREKYWAAALQETFTGVRNLSCLDSESFSNDLLRLDQITESSMRVQKHKVAVLFARKLGEKDVENDLEDISEDFREFLQLMGQEVRVDEDFLNYPGTLTADNSKFGVYKRFKHLEIMLEVLPAIHQEFREMSLRRCITVLVFLEEGAWDISLHCSSMLHNVIIVQPVVIEDVPMYRLAAAVRKGSPRYSPTIPHPAHFHRDSAFVEFLYHKIVNGERAAFYCTSSGAEKGNSLRDIMLRARRHAFRSALDAMQPKQAKEFSRALKQSKRTHGSDPLVVRDKASDTERQSSAPTGIRARASQLLKRRGSMHGRSSDDVA